MKEKKIQIMGHESLPSSSNDLSATPTITFTPGVPTEDGWYVVKVRWLNAEFYDTIQVAGLIADTDRVGTILSHAKLP